MAYPMFAEEIAEKANSPLKRNMELKKILHLSLLKTMLVFKNQSDANHLQNPCEK